MASSGGLSVSVSPGASAFFAGELFTTTVTLRNTLPPSAPRPPPSTSSPAPPHAPRPPPPRQAHAGHARAASSVTPSSWQRPPLTPQRDRPSAGYFDSVDPSSSSSARPSPHGSALHPSLSAAASASTSHPPSPASPTAARRTTSSYSPSLAVASPSISSADPALPTRKGLIGTAPAPAPLAGGAPGAGPGAGLYANGPRRPGMFGAAAGRGHARAQSMAVSSPDLRLGGAASAGAAGPGARNFTAPAQASAQRGYSAGQLGNGRRAGKDATGASSRLSLSCTSTKLTRARACRSAIGRRHPLPLRHASRRSRLPRRRRLPRLSLDLVRCAAHLSSPPDLRPPAHTIAPRLPGRRRRIFALVARRYRRGCRRGQHLRLGQRARASLDADAREPVGQRVGRRARPGGDEERPRRAARRTRRARVALLGVGLRAQVLLVAGGPCAKLLVVGIGSSAARALLGRAGARPEHDLGPVGVRAPRGRVRGRREPDQAGRVPRGQALARRRAGRRRRRRRDARGAQDAGRMEELVVQWWGRGRVGAGRCGWSGCGQGEGPGGRGGRGRGEPRGEEAARRRGARRAHAQLPAEHSRRRRRPQAGREQELCVGTFRCLSPAVVAALTRARSGRFSCTDTYTLRIPADLPPSFRGKAIKFNYHLVVGTHRILLSPSTAHHDAPRAGDAHGSVSRVMRVPLRVYNHVGGASSSSSSTSLLEKGRR